MKTGLLQDVLEKHLLPHYNDWHSQSPDLSPIENAWQTLNLAIDKRMPRIHSYQRLEEVVRENCNKIGKEVVLKCIRSMPKKNIRKLLGTTEAA
jgi:hypothetical protein